ncbi:MAG: polysaccharide pyruvyl transferase family protein [Promethearchaeota archaeon]
MVKNKEYFEEKYHVKLFFYHPLNLFLCALISKILPPIKWLKKVIISRFPILQLFSKSVLVVSLNQGDGFTDLYGIQRLLISDSPPMDIAINLKKPLVLLPQTIGPFNTLYGSYKAKKILNRANIIFTREQLSRKLVLRYAREENPEYMPDLAFLMETDDSFFLRNFDANRNYIGVNISGLLYNSVREYEFIATHQLENKIRYKDLIANVIEALMKETDDINATILLIPHTYSHEKKTSDLQACLEIFGEFKNKNKNRVEIIDSNLSAEEIKGVISHCEFFVGSRMHSCIAALSSGVPLFAIGYSHKYKGIMRELGVSEFVLDISGVQEPSVEIERILKAYRHREVIKKQINRRLETTLTLLDSLSLPLQTQEVLSANRRRGGKRLNVSSITDRNLCAGCGMCFSVCPTGAIKIIKGERNLPGIDKTLCVDCGKCLETCPSSSNNKYFVNNAFSHSSGFGFFSNAFYGHSLDRKLRYNASSGGIIKALVRYVIEKDKFDGVITLVENEDDPFEPVPEVVKSITMLPKITNSKYYPTSVCSKLREVFQGVPSRKKYVIIGKPCEIEAIRLFQQIHPEFRDRFFLIGIFCAHVPSRQATIDLLKNLGVEKNTVSKISYRGKGWPGTFVVDAGGECKSMPYEKAWALLSKKKYQHRRCSLCMDSTAELADLSIGDAWGVDDPEQVGFSFILSRNDDAEKLIQDMEKDSSIKMFKYELEKMKDFQPFLQNKKNLNSRIISIFQLLGLPYLKLQSFYPSKPGVIRIQSVLFNILKGLLLFSSINR